MDLGRYLVVHGPEDYECVLCNRFFGSKTALYAHCRHTTSHEWCERCFRVLVTREAKDAHIKNSHSHNICGRCVLRRDFETRAQLENHLVRAHYFCTSCKLYYSSSWRLERHDVKYHNLCVKCGDFFASKNNLHMHQQKHQPRNKECYGCYQTSKSLSGMLIHLESGSCASEATEDSIDDLASMCSWRWQYIDENRPRNNGWLYACPTCDMLFVKLSALYQHAEDVVGCSGPLSGSGCLARLERFIARKL